jgi:hypothetical protein
MDMQRTVRKMACRVYNMYIYIYHVYVSLSCNPQLPQPCEAPYWPWAVARRAASSTVAQTENDPQKKDQNKIH